MNTENFERIWSQFGENEGIKVIFTILERKIAGAGAFAGYALPVNINGYNELSTENILIVITKPEVNIQIINIDNWKTIYEYKIYLMIKYDNQREDKFKILKKKEDTLNKIIKYIKNNQESQCPEVHQLKDIKINNETTLYRDFVSWIITIKMQN